MSQLINGDMYSWSSISIRVGTELITKIKSISYGDSRMPVKGYGTGRQYGPIGQTSGKYETDPVTASIEKSEARGLRKALAKQAGSNSFGGVEFQIVVAYDEDTAADGVVKHITDTIKRCRWTKNAAKNEESADPLYEDIEFSCLFIDWDGTKLYEENQ